MWRYIVHKYIVILLFLSLSLSHNFRLSLSLSEFVFSGHPSQRAFRLQNQNSRRRRSSSRLKLKGRPARRTTTVESLDFNEASLPQPSPTGGDDTGSASKETRGQLGFGNMGTGCRFFGSFWVWAYGFGLPIFRRFLGLGCRSSGVFWWSGAVVMVAVCLVRCWSRDGCRLSGAVVMPWWLLVVCRSVHGSVWCVEVSRDDVFYLVFFCEDLLLKLIILIK